MPRSTPHRPTSAPTSWEQASLLPPEAVEVVARFGCVAPADHLQVTVEVREPASGKLLALWSIHHHSLAQHAAVMPTVLEEITRHFHPF